MFNGPKFLGLLGQLFGEPATLFKDKINYKLPGGTGFKAHQDAQGGWGEYGVSYHISSLVTIDHAFKENGCLELAKGQHKNGLMGELWNELPDDVIEKLKFDVVETHLGDVIFFGSYIPHQSGDNHTDKSRRVLYSTYNKAGEGSYRARYYADKRITLPPDIEKEEGKIYTYKIGPSVQKLQADQTN